MVVQLYKQTFKNWTIHFKWLDSWQINSISIKLLQQVCLIIQLYGERAGSKSHHHWLPLYCSFHRTILLQHMPDLLEGVTHWRQWQFKLIIKTVVLFMKGSLPAICVLLRGHKLCSLKWHNMQQENAFNNRKPSKIRSYLEFPPPWKTELLTKACQKAVYFETWF